MFLALSLYACPGPQGAADPPARHLTVAGYSAAREVYERAIFPAFTAEWKEETGEEVTFAATWQASGAQARAVRDGLDADVVALALDPDVAVLERAGLVTRDWRSGPNGGIATRSIVVLAVRPGNPLRITDWADLARGDVEVVAPNVRTSGGAMWNVLALYGAAARGRVAGTRPDEVVSLLSRVIARVAVMDKGARESLVTFEKGVGDVAVTYESEALAGPPLSYVVPSSTLLTENPLVVVDAHAATNGVLDVADAFVAFCATPEAQSLFRAHGFRGDAGARDDLFTVRDLGGWDEVRSTVFGPGGIYERATARAR